MIKRSFSLFACLVCVFFATHAQHVAIELTAGPGFHIRKFTSDSLVFANRQGNETLTFSAHSTLLAKYILKHEQFGLLAGVGLRFDQLTINRNNFADYLGDIFSGPVEDTVSIKKIRMGTDSYTFPVGVEYNFKGKPNGRHHLAARLLIVPGSTYQVRAYTKTDSARQVSHPMDLQKLSSQYEQQVSKFSLCIMPQLFFSLRIAHSNLSFHLSVAPPGIDLVTVYKKYATSGLGIMGSLGFQYDFKKKINDPKK